MPVNYFSKKLIRVVVAVAILGLLVFLNPFNFFNVFRDIFFRITYPIQKLNYGISFKLKSVGDVFSHINDLKKDNEKLLKENQELLAENASLNDINRENETLREQLKILPREKFNLESASVIGQDSMGLGNWIEIDKGRNFGIEKDMPVIVSNGILIGKVGEVFSNTARIILVSNPESIANVVDEKTDAKGVIKGEFGLGIVMDMVLQTDSLNRGDQIITSGIGSKMPRGLLVGRVNEISLSQDRLFQKATITSPVKFSQLQFVFVIKN